MGTNHGLGLDMGFSVERARSYTYEGSEKDYRLANSSTGDVEQGHKLK